MAELKQGPLVHEKLIELSMIHIQYRSTNMSTDNCCNIF